MEQKHIACGLVCDRLPTTSLKYPWFLVKSLDAEEADTKYKNLCTMYEWMSVHRSRLPRLNKRRIRGCFHGWVILAHNIMWYLWNPATSKTIHLPPLTLIDGDVESVQECFLSSPPNHPTSILMLTRTESPTIVICKLARKRKRLRWKELTYAKQLKSITGHDDGCLHCLTCYNGKVFALSRRSRVAVQVDIVVKDEEDVIYLFLFGELPYPFLTYSPASLLFLKGYCDDLFYIKIDFNELCGNTVVAVYLFKWDTTSMIWEEMEDLKDAFFFIDLTNEYSIFYHDAAALELGGYAHIFGGETGKVIYSYDVKGKTISQSPFSFYEQSSQWERELYGYGGETECETPEEDEIIMVRDMNNNTKNEENLEPHLLNIPFDVLKMIMELCVGAKYLNFRATCKRCHLAAPMIQWRNEASLRRLQTYSLVSPWLMVLDKHHQGIITFIDPMFGDKYFITTPQELIGDLQICCSRYGWLLLLKRINEGRGGRLFFFNPFTNDIRKLPDHAPNLYSFCFSDPPTCADCLVVGLSRSAPSEVFIHLPCSSSNHSWTLFQMDFGGATPHSFRFPTIRDGDTYALNEGALHVFLKKNPERNVFTNAVVAKAPGYSYAQCFLVNCCDEHRLVLVTVDEVGECVQVLKMNDSTQEWEKIDSLGRHVIYICGTTCLCVEAKTPEMENKIYFPLLHSKNGKMVFYSLETCRYHTFNADRNIQKGAGDFFGTKYHVNSHAWIQPCWS